MSANPLPLSPADNSSLTPEKLKLHTEGNHDDHLAFEPVDFDVDNLSGSLKLTVKQLRQAMANRRPSSLTTGSNNDQDSAEGAEGAANTETDDENILDPEKVNEEQDRIIETLQAQIKELIDQNRLINKKCNFLRGDLELALQKCRDCESRQKAAEANAEISIKRVKELEDEINNDEVLKKKTEALAKMTQELRELLDSKADQTYKDQRLNQLERLCSDQKADIEALQGKNRIIEEQLKRYKDIEDERNTLADKVAELKKQLDAEKKASAALDEKNKTVQNASEALVAKAKKLEAEKAVLKKQNTTLEEEVRKLKEINEQNVSRIEAVVKREEECDVKIKEALEKQEKAEEIARRVQNHDLERAKILEMVDAFHQKVHSVYDEDKENSEASKEQKQKTVIGLEQTLEKAKIRVQAAADRESIMNELKDTKRAVEDMDGNVKKNEAAVVNGNKTLLIIAGALILALLALLIVSIFYTGLKTILLELKDEMPNIEEIKEETKDFITKKVIGAEEIKNLAKKVGRKSGR